MLFEVVNPVGVGEDALVVVVLDAVEAVEGAAAVKVAMGDRGHGHIQLVTLAPADLPQVGFEEGDDQAKEDVAAQVGDGGFQVLGGDRLPEQGFVRVFELDDRVFYHQGQGVELLGDFVLTAKGKLEVGMGEPGIGQHLDDQILEGDGGVDLELVTAEDIQEREEEEVFVGVGGVAK